MTMTAAIIMALGLQTLGVADWYNRCRQIEPDNWNVHVSPCKMYPR